MKNSTTDTKLMDTCRVGTVAVIVVAFGLIAGCKNEDKGAPSLTSAAKVSDNGMVTIPRKSPAANYTFLDLSKNAYNPEEFEKIRVLTRDLYWSGMPKDMGKLALDFSPEYRHESNTFNRADLLKKLEPELQKKYEHAQEQKNYTVRTASLMQVEPYDAEKKGFRILLPNDMEEVMQLVNKDKDSSFGSWAITAVGLPVEDSMFYFKPKDESEARAIEQVLSSSRANPEDRVFVLVEYEGSAVGYIDQPFKSVVILSVDNIVAVDKKTGQKIFTINGEQLGRIRVKEKQTRQALNLPEAPAPKHMPYGTM